MIFHLYPIVTAAFQLIQLIKILQRGRKLFFQHTFGDISEYGIFIGCNGIFQMRCDKNDSHRRQRIVNLFCQLHAVRSRHFNIQQKKVIRKAILQIVQQILSRLIWPNLHVHTMRSEKFSCNLLQSGEHASIVVTYRYIQHGFVPSKLHSPFRYIFCILPQGAIFSSIT